MVYSGGDKEMGTRDLRSSDQSAPYWLVIWIPFSEPQLCYL